MSDRNLTVPQLKDEEIWMMSEKAKRNHFTFISDASDENVPHICGPELMLARKAAGVTQQQLADLVGCSVDTVRYWEQRAHLADCRRHFLARMLEELGIEPWPQGERPRLTHRTSPTHNFHWTVIRSDAVKPKVSCARSNTKQHNIVRCGAKTRKGSPCKLPPEPNKKRCRLHGGRSTGPKTPEGRAKIAEAQRRRWKKYRALFKDDYTQG